MQVDRGNGYGNDNFSNKNNKKIFDEDFQVWSMKNPQQYIQNYNNNSNANNYNNNGNQE